MIVLYMLDKVDFPLSNAQLCEFVLDGQYTSYFTIQQAISELVEAGFIRMESVNNTSLYYLTPSGSETLEFFGSKISPAIQADIDEFLKAHHYQLRSVSDIVAAYYETPNGEFAARCQIKSKDSVLVEVTLSVPDEEHAKSICSNWKQSNQEIYAYLMDKLL